MLKTLVIVAMTILLINKAGIMSVARNPTQPVKKPVMETDIQCEGQKLSPWSNKCHGSCSQSAKYGLTLLPCADQKECYLGTDACKGKPQCRE